MSSEKTVYFSISYGKICSQFLHMIFTVFSSQLADFDLHQSSKPRRRMTVKESPNRVEKLLVGLDDLLCVHNPDSPSVPIGKQLGARFFPNRARRILDKDYLGLLMS